MRYLIIPRQDPALSLVAAIDVRMDPESRAKQYSRLIELRNRRIGPGDTVAAAAMAAENSPATVLARPTERTPVTGCTIVEASPDQAEQLRQSLADAIVIPDLPLSLIEPRRSAASAKDAEELQPDDLWHLEKVGLTAARAGGFTGTGNGVVIAVADTGVQEVEEINGRVRAAYSIDVVSQRVTRLNETHDTFGHGTHVTGLICGKTVGVAPGAEVESIVMIPNALGSAANFVLTIEYIASQPDISILNMSAGLPGYHEEMQTPLANLRRAGVLPVIAIGNEGVDTSRSPGNYSSAFSVGASNSDDQVANFSGGGQMLVNNMTYTVPDLMAPGEHVTSCVMAGGYEAWDGTSMATPIVSGLAALIIERTPTISLADLQQELLEACVDLGFPPTRQGRGRVQLPASLWSAGA